MQSGISSATEERDVSVRKRIPILRRCDDRDLESILTIINDGAQAYKGVIPVDRWTQPYMPLEKLKHEISEGVEFWGLESHDALLGVMGLQFVQDVTLIRHAYVRTDNQKSGVGGRLLSHLKELVKGPLLVGTWADATWAIRFYQKHGFQCVDQGSKDVLLRKYWTVPERQIETSVVLADSKWMAMHTGALREIMASE
jgi:N-acetylglutamate synthase-like GNAT family acetyltransferase